MRIGAMRWRAIGVGVALATLLGACGGDAETGVAEGSPSVEDPSGGESPTETTGTVGIGETDLGSILVDAEGMTLYLFEADTDGTSTCYDECADAWPALIGDAPIAGEGIDEGLLGTAERDDGQAAGHLRRSPALLTSPPTRPPATRRGKAWATSGT